MTAEQIEMRDCQARQAIVRLRQLCTSNIPNTTFENAVATALSGNARGAFEYLEYFSYSYHHSGIRQVLTNLHDLGSRGALA
jgi:hypothetical protein